MLGRQVFVLATAGAALLASAGCTSSVPDEVEPRAQASSGESRIRVKPIKAQRKTLVRYCEQPGRVAAFEEAPLFPRIGGYVRRVHVDIGDHVRGPIHEGDAVLTPGQPLLEIDVPEQEKEREQKRTLVAQALADVRQAEAAAKVAAATTRAAIAVGEEVRAGADRVEAEVERWQAELRRITELAERQAVTDKLVAETRSKSQAAEAGKKEIAARIRAAEAKIVEAQAGEEKATADIASSQARKDVAAAELERLETLLGFATLRAPFDGIVAARHVDVGHLVTSGTSAKSPLLVVVNTSKVRIYVDVPEADAVRLQAQAEATIRLPAAPTEEIRGTVTRTTWVLDDATRTLRAEIDVPNPTGMWRPGMYAQARLKVAERPDVLVLPKSALVAAAGVTYCWRIDDDGTLHKQLVTTGLEAGGEFEILSGLSGNERLIGANPQAFRDGQIVDVAD